MPLIWGRTKAVYFCAVGSTGFADLPVVPVCRSASREIAFAGETKSPRNSACGSRECAPDDRLLDRNNTRRGAK
jgi:hypothetical protein